MNVDATSVGFYVVLGADKVEAGKAKTIKAPKTPPQKYHDTSPVRSPDYSFGTTPPNGGGYLSRPPSPTKSPKL